MKDCNICLFNNELMNIEKGLQRILEIFYTTYRRKK